MEQIQVELYEHVPNFAVLRLPPRRFPGVLIQGDSLSIRWDHARPVLAALESGDLDDARDWAGYLVDDLERRLRSYVAVLDRAGMALPFRRPEFREQPHEQPAARTSADTDGLRPVADERPGRQDPPNPKCGD